MKTDILYREPGRDYFACRVRHILTLSALGISSAQHYTAEHLQRTVDFLTCVINPGDSRLTYDLRLISQPDAENPAQGRCVVCVLCRLDGFREDEAWHHARNMLHLLEAEFNEYTIELATAEEIRTLLAPFDTRHLIALTRRAGLERLDTLKGRQHVKRLGFTRSDSPVTVHPPTIDAIFHVFPYLPTPKFFTSLLKLLLLESEAVAISCRLRPTSLTPEEETFLEEQIAPYRCR